MPRTDHVRRSQTIHRICQGNMWACHKLYVQYIACEYIQHVSPVVDRGGGGGFNIPQRFHFAYSLFGDPAPPPLWRISGSAPWWARYKMHVQYKWMWVNIEYNMQRRRKLSAVGGGGKSVSISVRMHIYTNSLYNSTRWQCCSARLTWFSFHNFNISLEKGMKMYLLL